MSLMLSWIPRIYDQYHFFDQIGNIYATSCSRVEEVIGQGNFKWVLLTLLFLLALWYARRQRLASL